AGGGYIRVRSELCVVVSESFFLRRFRVETHSRSVFGIASAASLGELQIISVGLILTTTTWGY
ncbi:MAG TPA: hypothetical protein VMY18_13285, partial [Acidobacteriota bacterium]|nr:hypothetical protein [Acidobacteriota bacterium]